MSYLDSGFNENLIRATYAETETYDSVNIGELINDGAIPFVAVDVQTDNVQSAMLADAAITTAKLANLAVDVTKLANLAVEAAKLADSAVTAQKIANAAVGSAAIANAAIGTAHIANAAITTAHIGDAQITTAKIGNAQITDAHIANLSADKINAGTVTGRTVKATGGAGLDVWIDSSDGKLKFLSGGALKASMYADATYSVIINSGNDVHFFWGANWMGGFTGNSFDLPSSHLISFAGGTQIQDAGSELQIDRQVRMNGTIYPRVHNSMDCGASDKGWDTCYATAFTDNSSIKLKKDVKTISTKALDKILNLRPVSFKWKDNDKEAVGFIAEEMIDIIPEVVHKSKIRDRAEIKALKKKELEKREAEEDLDQEEIIGINYNKLTVYLVKAMQEQQLLIENLKAKIK